MIWVAPLFKDSGLSLLSSTSLGAVETAASLPATTEGPVEAPRPPPEPRRVHAGPVGLVGHHQPDHLRPCHVMLRDLNARDPGVIVCHV